MLSKSTLAVQLSRLRTFENPKIWLEQYSTPSEIAAEALWIAFMNDEIKGRTVADFGSGTGILGIGALLLGARCVHFVENDPDAVAILKENLKGLDNWKIHEIDVSGFHTCVDIIVQNPPFGTKDRHADREFLMKAFELSKSVYSFHKSSTSGFVKAICHDHGFLLQEQKYFFPLKKTMKMHKKRQELIEVSLFIAKFK